MFRYESEPCLPLVTEITIVSEESWWEPRIPPRKPSEIRTLPERFRCYACGIVKGKRHFGGLILKQRLCCVCYPWLDESWVGAFIRWDEIHHFTQFIRD